MIEIFSKYTYYFNYNRKNKHYKLYFCYNRNSCLILQFYKSQHQKGFKNWESLIYNLLPQ